MSETQNKPKAVQVTCPADNPDLRNLTRLPEQTAPVKTAAKGKANGKSTATTTANIPA